MSSMLAEIILGGNIAIVEAKAFTWFTAILELDSMVAMSKKKTNEAADATPVEKRKRNAIFVSLDDETEALLNRFLDKQRVKPDRAAVAFTALVEFLKREVGDEVK